MENLTFIKLGGSIITDKRGKEAADLSIISRLARELNAARNVQPNHALVLGHGSGSYGHPYAARYGIHRGLGNGDDWMGFALTARAARRLHGILIDALLAARLPVLSLQPSASLHSSGRHIVHWNADTLVHAIERRLIPVIHGDVAFDATQGSSIISTESLFAYLALHTPLRPTRMLLVGKTAIHTADPHTDPTAQRISLINQYNIDEVLNQAGSSRAIDVTGGMQSKLVQMWELVQSIPGLQIHLINARPGLLTQAILGQADDEGTLIRQD
jgi:isopentenyl phosphate kinase